jgi:carbon storage regulator
MLVLSRKVGEMIMIGDGIAVVVNRISGNRVTLGIEAPDDVRIVRGELEFVVREFAEEAKQPQPASGRPAPGPGCSESHTFHAPLLAFRAAR